MIEYIRGELVETTPALAVIDCNGIGYAINISLNTYSAIQGKPNVKLYIHEAIREDAHVLFGFSTKQERELFLLLISVSGIGGNTARMILSTYSTSELRNIIATENAVLLKNVKGLGLKTAQKIIVELSGKMLELGAGDDVQPRLGVVDNSILNEAVAALVMLGFQKSASEKVVKAILEESPTAAVEDVVRQALRRL